jgi:hypothetical protein
VSVSCLKIAVFWVDAPCSLVEVYLLFWGNCCSIIRTMSHRLDDGGKHLWNVGELLPDYTAQQPRREPSSHSPPWKPEISLVSPTLTLYKSAFQIQNVSLFIVSFDFRSTQLLLSLNSLYLQRTCGEFYFRQKHFFKITFTLSLPFEG